MKPKTLPVLLVLSFLALTVAGCTAHPMVFDFNGRIIEIRDMQDATISRGLEITHFDGKTMQVNGREAIKVNGKDLTVNGSNVGLGDTRHTFGPEHKLVLDKDGKVSIVEKTSEKKSWWAFWR